MVKGSRTFLKTISKIKRRDIIFFKGKWLIIFEIFKGNVTCTSLTKLPQTKIRN